MKFLCMYYSATGNTERAVNLIQREIEKAGSLLEMTKIRKGTKIPALEGYDALVVAFPVLAFAPPAFVRGFLRSMPSADKGTNAFVLAVDGGGGRSAAARATRILERRGYEVVSSSSASYPDNWVELVQPPTEQTSVARTRSGDAQAMEFAAELLALTAKHPEAHREFSLLDNLASVAYGLIGRRYLGKFFYADEDCNSCGICARACPASTIILKTGPRAKPFWKTNCENCNACMNLCPKKAINTSIGRLFVLLGCTVALAILGILAYSGPFKASIGWNLPAELGIPIDIVSISLIIALAHILPIGPLDRYVIRFVQRIPGVRRFFAWTFTKGWRRYKAKPSEI